MVYPLHSLKIKPVKQKLNVVILCIDSWNKRTMNEECTPYIYRFAQKAENFTQHLSSSNATSGGIFGMFTGVSAYYWKSFDFGNVQPVMVEQLLKAGYKVQAYPSATLEYPPFAKLLFKNVKGLNIKTEGKHLTTVIFKSLKISFPIWKNMTANSLSFLSSSTTCPMLWKCQKKS